MSGSLVSRLQDRIGDARRGLKNARELLKHGRLGPDWRTPFETAWADHRVTLRHYPASAESVGAPVRPLLLVPPLMVTAEIYDISPDLSAVGYLTGQGADVWLADFGAPELVAGGLERTLDDHVLAISECVDRIVEATGAEVHLVGYSQGGMFCYQTVAFRKSLGVASVSAFGAPVDIRRNLPIQMHESLVARVISVLRRMIGRPLDAIRGLPGTFSSRAFKLLAPRQEVRHLIQMLGILHDRDALVAVEPKRRFLGGEGFIAWPGPALRTFIDQFVVQNRMKQGGFVIAGRTVSLSDITCPIVCFVGTRDDLAYPDSVRAIRVAAPDAPLTIVELDVGHFGLVIGTRALDDSWPVLLRHAAEADGVLKMRPRSAEPLLSERATSAGADLWARVGKVGVDLGEAFDTMRLSLPRLVRLMRLRPDARLSFSRVLARQARLRPDETFFLWRRRAYTYREASAHLGALMQALIAAGVGPGARVALDLESGPELLTAVGALNRLQAVALVGPGARTPEGASVDFVITSNVPATTTGPRVLLYARARDAYGWDSEAAEVDLGIGVVDLDAYLTNTKSLASAVAKTQMPDGWRADGGTGGELAVVFVDANGRSRSVSNRRWMALALRSANIVRLRPDETVWSCMSLHTPEGLLHAVGGALVGGARLGLGELRDDASVLPTFRPSFLQDIRNIGANIALLDAPTARVVIDQAPGADPTRHALRLFVGPGLDGPLAERLTNRFGQRVAVIDTLERRGRGRGSRFVGGAKISSPNRSEGK